MRDRRRGAALIELIAASLIFALSMAAMFQVWRLCFSMSNEGRDEAIASQLARTDLETVRVLGFSNLPLGELVPNVTPYLGSWTNTAQYFDKDGNSVTSSSPNKFFSLVRAGKDSDVYKSKTGLLYTLSFTSVRSITAKVTRLTDNKVMCTMGVKLVRGGL